MRFQNLLERLAALDDTKSAARYHGARYALAIALALTTYVFFPASPAVDSPLLEVGSIARTDIIAPIGYKVPKSSAELRSEREAAAATVAPILDFSPAAMDTALSQLRAFSDAVSRARAAGDSPAAKAAAIARAAGAQDISLSPLEAAYLASDASRRAMEAGVRRAMERWLASGVAATGELDDVSGSVTVRRTGDTRARRADSVLTFPTYLTRARQAHPDPTSTVGDAVYLRLLGAFFRPTLTLNRDATNITRRDLRRAVEQSKYEVRAGEKIAGAHEVVGKGEYEKMRALRDALAERTVGKRSAGRIVGAVLFNALVIAIFGITLVLFRPQLYASFRALLLFALIFLLVTMAAAVLAKLPVPHPELIPVALAAIIFSVLFDPRISLIAAMVLAVLIGGQSVYRGTNALFINLIGGVAAAFSVRIIRRRNQSYYSMLTIAAAYCLAAIAIGLTLDWSWSDIVRSAAWGLVNAAGSVTLAMFLLPSAEEFTGVDTYFKLLEWSDLNRPLLQRLSLEAPGTYAHTIVLANLVETACNAIGANGLLGRVGAYYHDIGKLAKPQYFVENQPKGRNPHDKLKPTTSAAIIRNHVKEGMELAEEYRLPRAIAAFITEHHGTARISYFLEKARERDGAPANPNEFIYPGPIPQSAETAVCMLADGVEAATRVLQDPTPEKIRDVIDHIVAQRIEQGQLREAPITLRQLEIIKEQFARALVGMYHNRIDYPAAGGGVTAEFASV